MLDGRVLEASQVEYNPFGKPPLQRDGSSSLQPGDGSLWKDGSLRRDGSSARRIIVERRIIGKTDHCEETDHRRDGPFRSSPVSVTS